MAPNTGDLVAAMPQPSLANGFPLTAPAEQSSPPNSLPSLPVESSSTQTPMPLVLQERRQGPATYTSLPSTLGEYFDC